MDNRLRLQELPFAARMTLSLFLIVVGLGYFSALVQLHMQHSNRDGTPLPTSDDVIERFSGLKRFDGHIPKSKLEQILSGSKGESFDSGNMVPAFFSKSGAKYDALCNQRGKGIVDAERETERAAMVAWITSPAESRLQNYSDDRFLLPDSLKANPLTAEYLDPKDKSVRIRTLIEDRCVRCHGGSQKPDLDDYAKLKPLMTAPKIERVGEKWVRSSRQMSLEALTQSTHAHLLSFAVLFTLTGLVTAFSDLPAVVRLILAPLVLLAQVLDIACWWLARLEGVGPYFAQAIVGTGAVVGLGLLLQILLGIGSLQGRKGRFVFLVLIIVAAVGGTFGYYAVVAPVLEAEPAAKIAAMRDKP